MDFQEVTLKNAPDKPGIIRIVQKANWSSQDYHKHNLQTIDRYDVVSSVKDHMELHEIETAEVLLTDTYAIALERGKELTTKNK